MIFWQTAGAKPINEININCTSSNLCDVGLYSKADWISAYRIDC